MNVSTISQTLAGLKDALEPLDVQVYDTMPDSPNVPCIIIYPAAIPYDITAGQTFIIWCLAGTVETVGSQQRLLRWLEQIPILIDADQQLGGTVSSCIPIEVRRWGPPLGINGAPRYWQAEIVCDILP